MIIAKKLQMVGLIKRELKQYFYTPIGYIFLIIFLALTGYLTFASGLGSFFLMREASLRSFFEFLPFSLVIFSPAITMRLWAEERRTGTIEFLLTLPISLGQAMIGKFIAAWLFIIFALCLTFPIVLTVSYLGQPDYILIFFGYCGSFLMSGTLLSLGICSSCLSKNQVVSFILGIVICSFFMMTSSPPVLDFLSFFMPRFFISMIENLSILSHFESMQRGVFLLSDFLYFVIMITAALFVSLFILHEKKAK